MAIEITKRPYSYCFSGNPVHYELYSAQAAADPAIYFEVRVMFKNISGVYAAAGTLPYSPINGTATIDVQDILEGLLEYDLPGFDVDEKTIWEVEKHTGKFYLEFREITPLSASPTWDGSEVDFACFIVKGGLSRFKYQGNNFWINYFDVFNPVKAFPFLSWQVRERIAGLQERMYLLYLNVTDVLNLRVYVTAKYTDGSTAFESNTFTNASKGVCYYIPAGAEQWGINNPAKELWYWDVEMQDAGGTPTSESFRFYADNRNDYNDETIYYRGSLGGLESVRVRGVIQQDLEYDFSEVNRTTTPNYYSGNKFEAQRIIINNKEVQIKRGDIGHLEKEEQDRLRDAFIKRESWQCVEKKWWPVNILTKNIKQKTTELTKWSLPIDWSLAHEGDYHYTPNAIDLGEGVFTENVCLAKLSPLVVAVDTTIVGANAEVTVTGTEVDPQNASSQFRYRFVGATNAYENWTDVNYSALPLVLLIPKNFIYTLEVQGICDNTMYGKKTTLEVNTNVSTPDPGPGPGPGGGNNSRIDNLTPNTTPFNVVIDFGAQDISGFVGGNNTSFFNVVDVFAGQVTVHLTFSASGVMIESDGVFYSPVGFSQNTWQFLNVNIVGGMIITVS